jgi:CheY-like chemotaxis protein
MAKTVLIVEDNELNMKLFHDLLEAHGYATVGTRNGNEALDLARRHRPDLILMDIQLPEVSGLDVTKWRRADPRGRMRGLFVQADLGCEVHRYRTPIPRTCLTGARASAAPHSLLGFLGEILAADGGGCLV